MILEALERDTGAALDLLRQHVDGCEVSQSRTRLSTISPALGTAPPTMPVFPP